MSHRGMSVKECKEHHMRPTLKHFPLNVTTKDSGGLPWGMSVQPFMNIPSELTCNKVHAEEVSRCRSCYAYINPFCQFQARSWCCALCGVDNHPDGSRYFHNELKRLTLPEVNMSLIEYSMEPESKIDTKTRKTTTKEIDVPAYMFVVDLSGSEEAVELIKASLLAALEALPDAVEIGLCVFSNKIGVFNLLSDIPYVGYARIDAVEGATMPLEDLLPSAKCLVSLTTAKENVGAALEVLSSHYTASDTFRQRAFGATLKCVLEYLQPLQKDVRIVCFLTGLPNYSVGKLDGSRIENDTKASLPKRMKPMTKFYAQLAQDAIQCGAGIDLFVIAENYAYVDLATLAPLCEDSGGNLLLYQNVHNCTLPQDLFRQLRNALAFRCMLRVRTSKTFKVARVFGGLSRDVQYENLYRMSTCDTRRSVYMDFGFNTTQGFSGPARPSAFIQTAFAYTTMVPQEDDTGNVLYFVPVRRLRVQTRRFEIARTWAALYDYAQPSEIISALTNKVLYEVRITGLDEARLVLEDWLINLLVCYNRLVQRTDSSGRKRALPAGEFKLEHVDLIFEGIPKFALIPRYVYGLLNHVLLSEKMHIDTRIYMHSLIQNLDAQYVLRMLYPSLYAFKDLNTQDDGQMYLRLDDVLSSPHQVFLMDAFTELIVFMRSDAPYPCPPPHHSFIRKIVKAKKDVAPLLSPQIHYVQQGTPEAQQQFERKLIEGTGFDTFSEAMKKECVSFLNEL